MSSIDAIKHSDTRSLIPTQEEAGMEQENPVVRDKTPLHIPFRNPIIHRGHDPELFWKGKYGSQDEQEGLDVDNRSLYRYEKIEPEMLLKRLYRTETLSNPQTSLFEAFGNSIDLDEIEKVSEYYRHPDQWSNRLIQGDSLMVMASLAKREGLTGKVQMVYFDPPYGIKYNSNWQNQLNDRNVTDGRDSDITREPEQIKAFRDTWIDGIHSYLGYLRDRLLVARDLLNESGSCFVQISDENMHLVRCLMDEVFGSENFVSQIIYTKTTGFSSVAISNVADSILWYAKNINSLKYRQLYKDKKAGDEGASIYKPIADFSVIPDSLKNHYSENRLVTLADLTSQGDSPNSEQTFEFGQKLYTPPKGLHWKTTVPGLKNLAKRQRIVSVGKSLRYLRLMDDYPVFPISNLWNDTGTGSFTDEKLYVVQTGTKAIQRCLLMTTDPGDLVLDPTCGSGTIGFVSEQWGRRWITIDTSRIAINIAKTRLLTATFPYYYLNAEVTIEKNEEKGKIKKVLRAKLAGEFQPDVRQGFVYEEVPHITLKSLANNEPPESETLFDKPYIDKSRLRVSGPFTVETLQSYEPVSPDELDRPATITTETDEVYERRIFEELKTAGVKNGDKAERAQFIRVERLGGESLHAEGFYESEKGESKAYFHIGPRYGTVSKQAFNAAVKECRSEGDADWLIILGFSFESNIENKTATSSMGGFQVTKVRMNDDLLQEGLLKSKKAGSFITIGEPDIVQVKTDAGIIIEVRGLDIYDPMQDKIKPRSLADIAYWMVDDDYNSSAFIPRQVFFCGGDKDEFSKWRKGLESLAKLTTKRNAETTLKIDIDDDAFDRLYGYQSHPIPAIKGRKIAVRVVSQFGEESTKVLTLIK